MRAMLRPFSLCYGAAVYVRNRLYDLGAAPTRRAGLPVISVGNLTAGGTGKTPMAIWLAELLAQEGRRPAVLSRGYRRLEAEGGPTLVSDGRAIVCSVEKSGDEPALMARRLLACGAMVIVGRDRLESARLAQSLGADIVILDDGFQHRRLARDLDIVLLDQARPFDNGWWLPAGMLREPPGSLRRAGAVVFTRCRHPVLPQEAARYLGQKTPVFFSRHRASSLVTWERWRAGRWDGPAGELAGPLLLFSGIARPDSFEQSLREMGGRIAGHLKFSDHHYYRPSDLEQIERAAEDGSLVVTTEKDAVRLPAAWEPRIRLLVLAMELSLEPPSDRERFKTLIEEKIRG